jgi:hypothetical protein
MKNLNEKSKDELIGIIHMLITERDQLEESNKRYRASTLRSDEKISILQAMINGAMEAM